MNLTLNKTKLKSLLAQKKSQNTNLRVILSWEDIPEFDKAEDEARFWRYHTISQELLDQIPESPTEEE